MDVLKFKYTYTTKFMLPLLFKHSTSFHKIFNESFINAYIADMINSENDDKIHLLFSDYPSLSLQTLLPKPISEYRHGDGYYVLVYDVPSDYTEDYINFLTGKYSQFTDKAKNQLTNFWNVDINSLLWGTLYKEGDKIKAFWKENFNENVETFSPSTEWWPPPNIEEEIIGLV